MRQIDIAPADLETVRCILSELAPELEMRAFGSRVSWTARATSDLDLALMTDEPLSIARMADLKAAFTKSDLPFRVDIVDWASTSEGFREMIEKNYVVLATRSSESFDERHSGVVGEWREVTLGEIAEVVGGSTPSTKALDNFDGDIPWLTPKDLTGTHDRYISRGARNLSRRGLDSCSAKLLPHGAVLLSTRAPVGYVAIAKNPIATNQGFRSLILRDDCIPEYIYYWMVANTRELELHASGTTFPELSGSSLKGICLSVPDTETQRAIAHILGTLDDKIELNRRTNKTLEAMARALFKSWFVDFDPIRAKMESRDTGLPKHIVDLFPDRLVNSELGEIPKGWAVGCLADVSVAPRRGVNPINLDTETPYIGLEHMPRQSIALTEWDRSAKVTSNKSIFEKGEFLFGKLRPYFHKVGIAPVSGVCSTDIVVVDAKAAAWSAFVLAVVSSTEFITYTDQASTGTKMPRTNWKVMGRYPLCLPGKPVVRVFQNAVAPLLDRIVANIHENRSLAALRDTLLPKLMSGNMCVREGEKVAEAMV